MTATIPVKKRQIICLNCGWRGIQSETHADVWHPGTCKRCTDGCSLYVVVLSGVGGFKPGRFAGDGSAWDGERYSANCAPIIN